VQPNRHVRPEFLAAFRELAARIASTLSHLPKRTLPIKMYVAGDAALHLYTGQRLSDDIDASFSHRIALPENLEVAYAGADGAAQLLYFDRQYNDTLGLLHEDAYEDSQSLALAGIDPAVLDVRLLSPLDLAISKLGRFADQDRDDIVALAKLKLIDSTALRARAESALARYVGDTSRVQGSIEVAVRILSDLEPRSAKRRP
jgi:Nucleotidyltransferase of unknown function (DUF6036)